MGTSPIALASAKSAPDFAAKPIVEFIAANQTALWHAARFLGGYDASRLVDRCAELLEHERSVSNHVRLMLDRLVALLTLEHGHDPNRPNMGYFAVISPTDPVIEEIGFLCDGLRHALKEFEARRDWTEARRKARAA